MNPCRVQHTAGWLGIVKGNRQIMALDKPKAPTVDTDPKQATESDLHDLAAKSNPPSKQAMKNFEELTYKFWGMLRSA